MLCKTCHYPLKQLSELRCPECGRGFDPGDPATFNPEHRPYDRRVVVTLCLVAFGLVLAFMGILHPVVSLALWPPAILISVYSLDRTYDVFEMEGPRTTWTFLLLSISICNLIGLLIWSVYLLARS